MDDQDSYILEWLGHPAYAAAGFVVVNSILSVGASAWPFDLGSVGWRYNTELALSGFMSAIVIGLLLCAIVAIAMRHRMVLRILVAIDGLWVALAILCAADYALNGLQIRAQVTLDNMVGFKLGVVKGVLVYLISAAIIGWIGVASNRTAKRLTKEQQSDAVAHPLVSI